MRGREQDDKEDAEHGDEGPLECAEPDGTHGEQPGRSARHHSGSPQRNPQQRQPNQPQQRKPAKHPDGPRPEQRPLKVHKLRVDPGQRR